MGRVELLPGSPAHKALGKPPAASSAWKTQQSSATKALPATYRYGSVSLKSLTSARLLPRRLPGWMEPVAPALSAKRA